MKNINKKEIDKLIRTTERCFNELFQTREMSMRNERSCDDLNVNPSRFARSKLVAKIHRKPPFHV